MYTLFNSTSSINKGIINPPYWEYIRQGMLRNLQHIVHYYRNNSTAVPAEHFLVRLLNSIDVPMSLSIDRYYDNVSDLSMNLSMSLKMTSSYYLGQMFPGVFYGDGVSEVLIANTEDFDTSIFALNQHHVHWQNIRAVKVLSHPICDTHLNLPDGTNNDCDKEYAVITIDIPKLAIQYRAFCLHETETMGDSGPQRTVMQFIRMYVLPNMLFSHVDQVICNRIMNNVLEEGLIETKNRHVFYLTNFDNKLDAAQDQTISLLNKIKRDFHSAMQNVPVIVKSDMEEAMLLPDLAETRQVLWALTLARLKTIRFLFKLVENDPGQRNQAEVNLIRQQLRQYYLNGIFQQAIPFSLYQAKVFPQLEQIYNLTS